MGGKGSGRPGGNPDIKKHSPIVQGASWNVDESMNSKVIDFALAISSLPDYDIGDPDAVDERISTYFRICAEKGMRPTMASMAQALGLSATTFSEMVRGFREGVTLGVTPASMERIKNGYKILATCFDSMLYEEKGSPVKWIFIGKNSFGYVDQKEQVVTHRDDPKRLSGATADEVASKYAQLVGVEDIPEAETYELPAGDDK